MTDTQTELKHFNQRLKKLSEGLELIKIYGLNEDLLISHLCHNLKISEKKAKALIESYEQFYRLILNEKIVKSLNTNEEAKQT